MSLARIASRFARDQNHKDAPIWGRGGVNRLVSGATDWQTVDGGGMLAAGVGGGITGRAANLFLIDDCLKNAEQALSEKIRESQWEWFQTCLPEGSPVMMATGEWKPIETIIPGESVASFKDSRLVTTKVVANGCSPIGPTYTVDTEYGSLDATSEHPFYKLPCKKSGKWLGLKHGEWVGAAELKPGDRVLMTLKGLGNKSKRTPGKRSYLGTDWWWLIGFIFGDGFIDTNSIRISLGNNEKLNEKLGELCDKYFGKHSIVECGREKTMRVYNTKAARQLKEYGLFKGITCKTKRIPAIVYQQRPSSRKAFIEGFVEADGYRKTPTRAIIGIANKDLLSDIRLLAISSGYICGQIKEYHFSAQPPGSPNPVNAIKYSLHIREKGLKFYAARVRSVTKNAVHVRTYNLETETGNYVANGFVVHNTAFTRLEPGGKLILLGTRWHAEDLLGRVLDFVTKETTLRIREVRFQAIAELEANQTDILGRVNGEALWPERWPVEALLRIKSALADYWWQALYQQNLTQHSSNEWPESYFWGVMVEPEAWPENLVLSATALDPSKGKDAKKGDFQAIVNTGYLDGYLWVECEIDRQPISEMIDDLVQFNMRIRPTVTGIEAVAFQELLAPVYLQAQLDYSYYDQPELIQNTTPKRIRIARLGYWLRRHRIKIKNNASGQLLLKQLKAFPNGDHDDGCFAAGTLVQTNRGNIPIEDVAEGDEAWTRHGWTKVLASQCTGVKPVSKYLFEQGISLLATSEHPVYSQGHFQPIQHARSVELCLNVEASELNQSQCFSMESSLSDIRKQSSGRTGGISHQTELIAAMGSRHFIVKYGKVTTDRSQKVCIFTTKTETHSTTQLTTSTVSLNKSTQNCTEKTLVRGSKENDFLKKLSPKQRSGISQMKVGIGTVSTPKRLQMESNQKNAPASSAESHSSANIHTKQPTAVRSAGKDNTQSTMEHSLDSMICNAKNAQSDSSLKRGMPSFAHRDASSVSAIGSIYLGEMPVYNMTTQNGEYTANGIVVHNCDALEMSIRLLLQVSEQLQDVMSADGGADAASILEP